MAVYVDSAKNGYGRMKVCHMIADTPEDRHSMAAKIGVARRWFQEMASFPHYDIAQSKRALAISHGAVEVSSVRDMGLRMREIRNAKIWRPLEGGWA